MRQVKSIVSNDHQNGKCLFSKDFSCNTGMFFPQYLCLTMKKPRLIRLLLIIQLWSRLEALSGVSPILYKGTIDRMLLYNSHADDDTWERERKIVSQSAFPLKSSKPTRMTMPGIQRSDPMVSGKPRIRCPQQSRLWKLLDELPRDAFFRMSVKYINWSGGRKQAIIARPYAVATSPSPYPRPSPFPNCPITEKIPRATIWNLPIQKMPL